MRLVLTLLWCSAGWTQTAKATFEVASVKPATPLGPMGMRADRKGGPGTTDPGMYTCTNCPISWVLSEAYGGLLPFEYSGPEWLDAVRFNFAAKLPPGTTKNAFEEMLQSLLMERFKLAAHREKKEMSVYELTVARNGPKFKEAVPQAGLQSDDPPGRMQRDSDGFPILTAGMTMAIVPGHARLRSTNQPISWLASMLKGQLGAPVIDATELTAKYDFTVSWAFADGSAASADGVLLEPPGPSLISAVQSQLGLRLERKKGPGEVLVIDHIEKVPTEN